MSVTSERGASSPAAGLGAPRTFPLVEAFGPTIQGEGPDAGRRCFFIRLGGCDYRCAWCDSMHAVEPAAVREAPRRSAVEIAEELFDKGAGAGDLIVISGGNPALHHADVLVRVLHGLGYRVSVETQGSFWRPWLGKVDRLVVSPKPPSSGEASLTNYSRFVAFLREALAAGLSEELAIKIVVFNQTDFDWAKGLLRRHSAAAAWLGLSCGTDSKGKEPLAETAGRYRWLCETVAADRDLARVVVLPQLHVIAWSHEVGR